MVIEINSRHAIRRGDFDDEIAPFVLQYTRDLRQWHDERAEELVEQAVDSKSPRGSSKAGGQRRRTRKAGRREGGRTPLNIVARLPVCMHGARLLEWQSWIGVSK